MANLTSKEWRDLIFEGKNKEFGAYDLRKKSEKRHTLAVIFTLIGLVVVILMVIGYSKFSEWQEQKRLEELMLEREKMSNIEMEAEEVPEEEQEEQKVEVEEQKPEEIPDQVPEAQVQQTQIAIVPPDQVKNEVKDIRELIENNDIRGKKDQEGQEANFEKAELPAPIEQATKKIEAPAPTVPEPPKPPEPPKEDNKVFEAVEQPPAFPGGEAALMKWLSSNIRYPESAQQNGTQGRVIIRFVVEKDGSISDVKVAKGVDKELDNEAVRVVKRMPKWQPGKNNGQAVRTAFNLPVTFKLQNQ